jgi:hypothetical protein
LSKVVNRCVVTWPAVQHQAEIPQVGAIAALEACWQRRDDRARRKPIYHSLPFHARLPEGWAWQQIFQARNSSRGSWLSTFSRVFSILSWSFPLEASGFQPRAPQSDIRPVGPLHQTRHELTQRLQRQRISMLSHREAALRHEGSEPGFTRNRNNRIWSSYCFSASRGKQADFGDGAETISKSGEASR